MNILAVAGIGVVGAALTVTLRAKSPEYSLAVGIVTALTILGMLFYSLSGINDRISSLLQNAGSAKEYGSVLIKALGISLLTQLACDACKDAGVASIASKVELGGKVAILLCAYPLLEKLLELTGQLIGI